jgi:maleamate amidohydrolase
MTESRGLDQMFAFYRQRGYTARLGAGRRCALLVIDFSLAFTQSASGFPGGAFESALAATQRVLTAARQRGVPRIFTIIAYQPDMSDAGLWAIKVPWLRLCQYGNASTDIDPALQRQPGELVLIKKYPSAFFRTELHEILQESQVDTLLITGCTTSVCVRATTLDAMQHGYRPLVVREAVGDFDPALHELHLADLDARYADVVSLEQALDVLKAGVP